jgi:hypothetical protein
VFESKVVAPQAYVLRLPPAAAPYLPLVFGADSFLAIHAGTVGINPLSTVPIPGAIWLFGSIAAIFGGVRQLLRIKHKRLAAA